MARAMQGWFLWRQHTFQRQGILRPLLPPPFLLPQSTAQKRDLSQRYVSKLGSLLAWSEALKTLVFSPCG